MELALEVHHMWSLAPSVRAVRETTEEKRDVVLLSWVINREDNLQQSKHEEINNHTLMDSLSKLWRHIQLPNYSSPPEEDVSLTSTYG